MPNSSRKRMLEPDEQHGTSVHIRAAAARLLALGTLGTAFPVWALGHWLK